MECFDDDETCKQMTHQKTAKISPSQAAIGRDKRPFDIIDKHAVNGNKMLEPFPESLSGRAMWQVAKINCAIWVTLCILSQ